MVTLEQLKVAKQKLLTSIGFSNFYGNWGRSRTHVQRCRRAAARLQSRINKIERGA